MLLSLDWLKDFVSIPKNIKLEKLSELLTMHTAEVESVKRTLKGAATALGVAAGFMPALDNIVVGKVLGIRKHPNADKLKIVLVDIGEKESAPSSDGVIRGMKVVCGAQNLYQGMLVPFAKVGARVRWHGEGELVRLEKAKIRGVESEGMICAAEEIGLSEEIEGIMDISETKATPGTPLKKALQLDDVVLEIDNKSITHRPDLWSHLGVAREISVLLKTRLKPILLNNWSSSREAASLTRPYGRYSEPTKEVKVDFKIKIDDYKKCPRFMGVVVDNIKIEPSPKWLQNRLRAIGLRPINNIVDVTNYVLYEIGQPMHAYDRRDVAGDLLGTRMAKDGEKFITLDDEERKLTKDDLVVIDAKKAVSLAGIMGGQNTEIKDDTTAVILEAANFAPTTVRKTSLRLGLRTDSSVRFEKGLDPNLAAMAISRALELIFRLCPGARIVSKIIDEGKFKPVQGLLKVSYQYLIDRIGVKIPLARVEEILRGLGFEVKIQKGDITVKVPTWRATGDVSIPEDIVEEVARIYGYDDIPILTPKVELVPAKINSQKLVEDKIKDLLAFGFGMTEVYSYAFADEEQLKKMGIDCRDYVRIANPLAANQTLLKQTLIPNLINKAKDNLRFFETFRLFEIAKVFYLDSRLRGNDIEGNIALALSFPRKRESKIKDKETFSEEKMVAGVLLESAEPFYMAKGIIDGLGRSLGINFEYKKLDKYLYGQGPWVEVYIGKKVIGVLGELDIEEKMPLGFFELKLKPLADYYNLDRKFEPLPKFPEVRLDLSIILDDGVEWENIYRAVLETGGELVRQVELFDIYKGTGMEKNKKSLAFHIVYRADDRTLELREVETIQEKIIKILENKFGAKVRS